MNQLIKISTFKDNKQHINISDTSHVTGGNIFLKYKAEKAAKRIIKSLNEVKDFESGKKQPKSFDTFLEEL